MSRSIVIGFYVKWDFTSWTNESAYVLSANGDMAYTPPGAGFSSGRGIISTMTVQLDNTTGRFSPFDSGGALYSYLQDGKAYHAPCMMQVSIDGGSNDYTIFTGVIKFPQIVGATFQKPAIATLECRSNEEKYLQQHASTTLADFVDYHDTGYDEAQIITELLTNAGISGGDMDIDTGLIKIPWVWMDDESVIEECWRLAAACGGRFYCTPDGKFKYENFTYWARSAESTSPQKVYSTDEFSEYEPTYDDKDLFNSVLVEAAPRQPLAGDTMWTADEPIRVLPGETRTVIARLRQPAYTITDLSYTALTSGGTDISGSVTVTPTYYAQRVEMEIANAHATHTAYIDMEIIGEAVSGSITIEEERNSTDNGTNSAFFTARGDRRKSVRGNVYIQSRAHAAMVADFLLTQSETPRVLHKISGTPGDPELRLGWQISVDDDSIMTTGREGIVTSIRWRLNRSGFSQDIEAIDTSGLFANSGYFIIGTNKLGSAGAGIAQLFY